MGRCSEEALSPYTLSRAHAREGKTIPLMTLIELMNADRKRVQPNSRFYQGRREGREEFKAKKEATWSATALGCDGRIFTNGKDFD